MSTPDSHASSAPPRGRIVAYDALRVFAIVSVVAIHTLMPYRGSAADTSAVRVFDDLLHYAVPLFVALSGALVWGRPWHGGPGPYRTFLARRLGVIGLPFLAWAALYAAILVAQSAGPAEVLRRLPGLIATGHVWYHLYFVPMLLTFYLFTPLAARAVRRQPELFFLGLLAFRIVAAPAVTSVARDLGGDLAWAYAQHVMTHLPHMALGAWLAVRLDVLPGWVRRGWAAWCAAGLLPLWAWYAGLLSGWPPEVRRLVYPLAMPALVLGMILGAMALEPRYERWSRPLTHAGSLAFGVYFVHPLLLLGVNEVLAATRAEGLWLAPAFPVAVWAAVCAGSFALAELLARGRRTAWLVGLAPRS